MTHRPPDRKPVGEIDVDKQSAPKAEQLQRLVPAWLGRLALECGIQPPREGHPKAAQGDQQPRHRQPVALGLPIREGKRQVLAMVLLIEG